MITEQEYLNALEKKKEIYSRPFPENFDIDKWFSESDTEEDAVIEIIEQYIRENPIEFRVETFKHLADCEENERMNKWYDFRVPTLADGIKKFSNIYAEMGNNRKITNIWAYHSKKCKNIIETAGDEEILRIDRQTVEDEKIEINDLRIIGFLSKMHMKYM